MKLEDLKVGKKYYKKFERDNVFTIEWTDGIIALFKYEKGYFELNYDITRIEFEEYKKPEIDIFEGINEGDIVKIVTRKDAFVGFVFHTENNIISISETNNLYASIDIQYEDIISIQKLTPEKPNSITIDKDVLREIIHSVYFNAYEVGWIEEYKIVDEYTEQTMEEIEQKSKEEV